MLLAVILATGLSAAFDLGRSAQLAVLGPMPQGLPALKLPWIGWSDLAQLLPGAAIIAMLSFADTSVLSRSLAARGNYRVSQDQEMFAVGVANIAAGLFQGFPVSSSASRTPVAESAGSRSQVTGLVGALAIAALLILAPNLLRHLPSALLGAVVIAACLSFADVPGMLRLYRQRRMEFALSAISFLGVAFVGVIEGIVITILLAMLVLVWNAWHPYSATLVRVDGRKGFHDVQRHPEGRSVPGLEIFRWDAQLFFANAEIFRYRVLQVVAELADTPEVADRGGRCHHRHRHHRGGFAAVAASGTAATGGGTALCRVEGTGQGPAGPLRADDVDRRRPFLAHGGQCRQPLSQPARRSTGRTGTRYRACPGSTSLAIERTARRQERPVVARAAPTHIRRSRSGSPRSCAPRAAVHRPPLPA